MGQGGQSGPILKPVSDGYTPGVFAQDYHPKQDAEVIRKALSAGVSTDEDALIHILPFLTPAQLESIRHCLYAESNVVLSDLVEKKIGSNFRDAVRAVVLGPLDFDVWLLHRAMDGVGTNVTYLNLVLLGRKNGDIDAIKAAYYRRYKKHLVEEIRKELSGEVEALFTDALEARRVDESVPINDAQIDLDVKDLYTAMVGKSEGNRVSEILVTRSDAQIRKIIQIYESRYKGKTLDEVVKKKFKGHMEEALIYIINGAKNKALRDAKLVEKTMKGLGTKNEQLGYRLAILHWDKAHFKAVKAAYKAEFPKRGSLASRVEGETSGDQQKFLLALLED
jgi:annexin A7/11